MRGPDSIEGARKNRHFSLVLHDPKGSHYENLEVKVPTGRDKMAKIERETKIKQPLKGKEVIKMPFGDGTGPMGLGPMTGRRAGFCAGYGVPGFANPLPGYPSRYDYPGLIPLRPRWGWGLSRGWWGRGFGRGWPTGVPYGYPWR